jgi:DNA-binding winged helix-turn-helix (wHTH) protein/tetratricopeptide (TPR) repeat protein
MGFAMMLFHSFRLDTVNHSLWREQERVPVTPKAFDVLRYFVEHPGRLVSQDELLEALWPETYVNPELIKKYIREIRKTLGDSPESSAFIKTFPKRGYEFVAPVSDALSGVTAHTSAEGMKIVGREKALTSLHGLLDKAGRGQRQVVFITGEAGIGKTTLVDAFLQQATGNSESQSARGQCVEGFGGKEAYYPVLEALGQLLRADGSGPVFEVLSKQAPTWLIQFPSLIKPKHQDVLQREILGSTRERMLREICEALEVLTGESLLCLILEDLHWSDPSTLDLISAIARRRGPAKLMILGTYRPVDVVLSQSPLKAIKQDLLVHQLCSEVALERLEEPQIAQYLVAEFGMDNLPEGLANLVYRHSGGNALFMIAIVQELTKQGVIAQGTDGWVLTTPIMKIQVDVPETLQHLLDLQFEQLSAPEQQVLKTASVAGEHFSVWAITDALEMGTERIEDTCEGLCERGRFITSTGIRELENGTTSASYGFKHSLYRQAVYRKLSDMSRSRLHRSLGERLSTLYSTNRPELASELALHFEEGGDYERAVDYLLLSAENAARRFAHRDSIQILQHAQEFFPKLSADIRIEREILVSKRIGDAHYALGEVIEAAQAYEMEVAQAAQAGRTEAQVSALSRLAYAAAITDAERGIAASERAVQVSTGVGDHLLLPRAQVLAAGFRIVLDRWRQGDAAICAAAEPVVDPALSTDAPAVNEMLYASHARIFRGEYREALQNTEAAIPKAGATTSLMQYLGWWGEMLALLHMGQLGELLRVLRTAIAMAQRNGNNLWFFAFTGIEAWLRILTSDFDGARRLCEPILQAGLGWAARTPKAMALLFLGHAEIGLGNSREAVRHFSAVEEMTKEKFYLYWYWRMQAQLGMSSAWLETGNLAKARHEADCFLESALSTDDPNLRALAWEIKARIAVASGEWTEAEPFVLQSLAILQRLDVPIAAWQVHATAWDVYRQLRQEDKAEQHRSAAETVVRAIANSFASDEPLRAIFLKSLPVRRVLVNTSELNTRAAATATNVN